MFRYIIRRVLQFIPVFFGVTLALFVIANYLPGADAVQMRVGEKAMNPALRARIIHDLGLDRPWYVQYGDYLTKLSPIQISKAKGVVFGPPDLGVSLYNGRPVMDILAEAYPYTVELSLAAIAIEIVVGIGAGIVSAIRRYSFWDVFLTLGTSILVSVPVFWLGIMLQYVFGTWLKEVTHGAFYLPPVFYGGSDAEFGPIAYLILPAITLASVSTAYAARIMRSQLLEVNGQDFIRTAHAKGLSNQQVLWRHSIKNALIPVVTFIGLDLGAMLAGAILTETVFNWPGIGWTVYRAIVGRDFPIVFGGVTVILFIVMFVNLAVDISYAFLDPRIRFGEAGE
jgi:ABC-type dipeptide/oligopeptide/nickel transport system permease component